MLVASQGYKVTTMIFKVSCVLNSFDAPLAAAIAELEALL